MNSKSILFGLVLIFLLISCQEKYHKVLDYESIDMSKTDLLNSDNTRKFIELALATPSSRYYIPNEIFDNRYQETKRSKKNKESLELQIKRDSFIKEFVDEMYDKGYTGSTWDLYEAANNEYNKETQKELEKFLTSEQKKSTDHEPDTTFESIIRQIKLDENRLVDDVKRKMSKDNLIGINTRFKITNNTKQIIDECNLNSVYIFDYKLSRYVYRKSYSLIRNDSKNWNPNDTIQANIFDIINYSKSFKPEIFEKHKPIKVKHFIYISSTNSIGFQNSKVASKFSFTDKFGEIVKHEEGHDLNYGELIFEKDVTDIFK